MIKADFEQTRLGGITAPPHARRTMRLAHEFEKSLIEERNRSLYIGSEGYLAYLSLAELHRMSDRLTLEEVSEIWRQVAEILEEVLRFQDVIDWSTENIAGLLLPDMPEEPLRRLLGSLGNRIVNHSFDLGEERLNLTPCFGFTDLQSGGTPRQLKHHALAALCHAEQHLDLRPVRFKPPMEPVGRAESGGKRSTFLRRLERVQRSIKLPWQILLSMILGGILPYAGYAGLDAVFHDITPFVYLFVTAALVLTSGMIWAEGFLAGRAALPPVEPGTPYPPASAIIAAYLPNEAPTILDTISAFLKIEYPEPLQIILAYNTPHDLPVEKSLREIARRNPRFIPFRVDHSTSKAQNVNKALGLVNGIFVGVFDADHHPEPQNFTRAWRWLSHGADVVQGHCTVRNGTASWISRMIAVEFEAIYAVSHPGRAALYDFGIFGGSNGYWKTDLLRKTRMHGFMLTEDIDSSIRILTDGAKIVSDPKLISRELAPTSLKALWNQRLRWAQGWHQVSLKHMINALRSRNLAVRQKIGMIWLLGWREIYPWVSLQILPIILYWIWKHGGTDQVEWLIPIFILTSLFVTSVAPGQAYLAYTLGDREIRKHRGWFIFYLIVGTIFYSEFKNIIARVAQIKELFKERHWKVTPRMESEERVPR